MKKFPKRYTKEDLRCLEQHYLWEQPCEGECFSVSSLPSIQPLHLGHLYGLYLKDYHLKIRERKQQGRVGHAIVFQWKNLLSVSDAQQFFAKKHQTLQQVGRKKLYNYLLSRWEKGIKANTKRLALAFGEYQWYRENEPAFALFVQQFFQKAQKAGKITVKKNIAYRSVNLQTTIPQEQIVFEQLKGKNYTVKYFIETKNDVLSVCTRVPDLIFGDVALLVHPGDRRYKKLIGKKAIVPVVNRTIPVIGDASVDISKDNGIKRVCPCYDEESIALAEKYKLPLDHYVFTADGNYTEYAGDFAGKPRKEFYTNILQYLDDISNLWVSYDELWNIPYSLSTHEQLHPFLVDEVILDLEQEKAFVQQEVDQWVLRQPIKDQLLPLISKVSGVLNRQISWWIPLPLGEKEKLFEQEVFDGDLVSALYYVFLFQQGISLDTTLFIEEHEFPSLAQTLVLHRFFLKKPLFKELQLFPSLLGKKGEKFSHQSLQTSQLFTLLDQYGQCPVRLSLLIHNHLDPEMIALYDLFLRQLRNGARYCFLRGSQPTNLKEAWKLFEKKADAFDVWIMGEFLLLWKECSVASSTTSSFSLIQQFVQRKFLWRYLEVKKEYEGGVMEATTFLLFTWLLDLLYPFVPSYVRAMLQVSGLPLHVFTPASLPKEKSIQQVVWLYELFELILLFRLQLAIKKHQKIALFVKADPNSLALFERYQVLVRKLLNIQELLFVRLHEEEPQDYQQELHQGMIIGIKLITSVSDPSKSKKLALQELEAQYAQQGEYLAYLRTMIASMSSLGESEQLVAKKQELEEVKQRIDDLLIQIQKMRIKGKN